MANLVNIITLDKDKIAAFIVGDIGIKHSQLMLLGEYPMRTGWRKRLTGLKINEWEFKLLARSKGMYFDN